MANSDEVFAQRVETLKRLSSESGFKLTHQRLQVFDILSDAEDHSSAEQVFERVRLKIPSISFDTVYRTLELFERYGIIARFHQLDDRTRYDPNTQQHYHLVCARCKKITDVEWLALDELGIPRESEDWGTIESRHMELRGICRDCL